MRTILKIKIFSFEIKSDNFGIKKHFEKTKFKCLNH